MNEIIIQNLLKEVYAIDNKYQEIADITGEKFNVFDILSRSKHENSHSAFIAELLNPKGSHGCKGAFLKLFIKQFMNDEQFVNFGEGEISVFTEYFIGFKSKEEEIESEDPLNFSGRIDILIEDRSDKTLVIIENKIAAKDQRNQLKRYYEFAMKTNFYFKIFYLKPFLGIATIDSTVNLKADIEKENSIHYFCISYKDDILKWLDECIKEASSYPLVRETIRQYILLLRKLTNQANGNKMNEELIKKMLSNVENFSASKFIYGEFENAKSVLLKNFWEELKNKLEKDLKTKIVIDYKKGNENIYVTWCPTMFIDTENDDVKIGIEPLNGKHWKGDFNSLFIGIFNRNNKTDNDKPFPGWCEVEHTNYNFADFDTLEKIIPNTNSRNEVIMEISKRVKNKIELVTKKKKLN